MVDKTAYLRRRQERQAEAVTYKREKTCFRCYWLQEHCLCPQFETFATDTRFVILMHPMEAKKEKLGTGRICRAALANSEIIVGLDFTRNAEVNALIADPGNACMVMYPGEKSLNISRDDISPLLAVKSSGRRLIVFLIDGTWSCAKKMMRLSLNVRALPRVSFSASHRSIFYIKQQPADYCLSTLESIHFFLCEADRRGLERLPGRPHDSLLKVFRSMIDFSIKCALDPSKSSYRGSPTGYTRPEDRQGRNKWSQRAIVLPD